MLKLKKNNSGAIRLTCSVSVLSSCTIVTRVCSGSGQGQKLTDRCPSHYMKLSTHKLSKFKSCKIVTSWFSCRIHSRTCKLSNYRQCNFTILYTGMRRITTFRPTTDRIYDSGKNFWKLQISWFRRKITCQSKCSTWMKPSYCGNGCLKGHSCIRRPSKCLVSRLI